MTLQAETHPVLGGTDGFRGQFTPTQEPGAINEATFAGLTTALIQHQQEQGEWGPLVIGRDTRSSSQALARSVIRGAHACGIQVIDLGIAPTPAIQYVADARHSAAIAAVAITASHNPAADNGWKGMLGNRKPNRVEVTAISDRFWQQQSESKPQRQQPLSAVRSHPEFVHQDYARAIITSVETTYGERPLAGKLFVVDGANGAASRLTPKVFRALGANVVEFSCNLMGAINQDCGAAELSGVQRFLRDRDQLLNYPDFVGAVANDGDADRMMAVGVRQGASGPETVTLDGNYALWSLAQGEPGIVGTEYTNSGLVTRLRSADIGFEYCANGDAHVTQRLQQLQASGLPWRRGGEFTGHHIDTDWLPSGDGVRMAALYAAHAVSQGKTFADLHQELPLWSETMAKLRVPAHLSDSIANHELVLAQKRQVESELGDSARVIIRPSGTEPVVRVWVESPNASSAMWAGKSLLTALSAASSNTT